MRERSQGFSSLKLIGGVVALFVVSLAVGMLWFRQTAPVASAVTNVARIFILDATTLFGKQHLSVLLIGLDYDSTNSIRRRRNRRVAISSWRSTWI